jgi:hypothetical protein
VACFTSTNSPHSDIAVTPHGDLSGACRRPGAVVRGSRPRPDSMRSREQIYTRLSRTASTKLARTEFLGPTRLASGSGTELWFCLQKWALTSSANGVLASHTRDCGGDYCTSKQLEGRTRARSRPARSGRINTKSLTASGSQSAQAEFLGPIPSRRASNAPAIAAAVSASPVRGARVRPSRRTAGRVGATRSATIRPQWSDFAARVHGIDSLYSRR